MLGYGRRRRRAPLAACAALALALGGAGAASAAFPEDPPNDPSYDRAEEGGLQTCLEQSVNDEQHYLYSFMPQCSPLASDSDGAAGMSVNTAWRDFTTGNGRTKIAYIEAGINWQNSPGELANRVFLNEGELPAPTTPVDDDTLNALDYADTPDVNGNGLVDPEDIIVRFSDGQDDDGNGYVDDISGWDFYNNQNDPATTDTAYGHANGQMRQAVAEGDNGSGGIGICPHCMVMPIKAGAEALDRTDDLAEAWLYASDMGADVIVSVTADLGYSSFMAQVVEEIWNRGDTVMVEASNDFNSIDHQGGQFHPHVLPGNGLVSNSQGIPTPAANAVTTTYRARSGVTSWGTHNMFSAATQGGSTSESTPTVGGVMALTIAYGKEAADENLISSPLTASEAIQVVRATASDIDGNPNPPLGWTGKPGFDMQYGYGRPHVHRALQAIEDGEIPPVAWFDAPDWYELFDPTDTESVPVRGHVGAPRSGSYDWVLEFAPGPEPTDAQFQEAASGSETGPRDGLLGSIDLSDVPQSFWDDAMEISQTKELETNDKFTVSLRLRVTDEDGRVGEERRAIAVHHDESIRDGFPKKIGPAGESQPVLADLQGTGKLAAIFGDADGRVHAIGPNGNELPGWPAHTNPTQVERSHPGIDPGFEPIVAGVAVGDLGHTGELSVVATSTTGRVYAFNADGELRSGWPKTLDEGSVTPAIPRPEQPFTRLPHTGATATPVLVDLNEDKELEVVQAAWDGRLYAFNRDGSDVAGYPFKAEIPDPSSVLVKDHKLDGSPAVAELDGDPTPELVVRSQFTDAPGGGIQFGGTSHVLAYNADGTPVPGFPIEAPALVVYYGSAQEFITEGINLPITADVDDDGKDEIAFAAGIFSPTVLYESDGSASGTYGPLPDATAGLLNGNLGVETLLAILGGDLPTDTPINFTTSGAFGKLGPGDQLAFAEPGTGAASVVGALLLPGSGIPINNYMRAFNAQSQEPVPGFPSELQGLDFLGAPAIADVTGDGSAEVIEGGDSSALHAYEATTGAQAAGFPKFQTGWIVFGPAVGDLDTDGRNDILAATREGYLYAWETNGVATGNEEWWQYRHDERNTARYGVDTRPPGILRDAELAGAGSRVIFKAPGDDWYAGTADRYEAVTSGSPINASNFDSKDPLGGEPEPVDPGQSQTYDLPPTAKRFVAIRAVDEQGNVCRIVVVDRGVALGKCDGGILGDDDPNVLTGTDGPDAIRGLGGADEIRGRRGADCLAGDDGDDEIHGGRGRDELWGGDGDDEFFAVGGSNDVVHCGPGDDRVHAGHHDVVGASCERVTRGR